MNKKKAGKRLLCCLMVCVLIVISLPIESYAADLYEEEVARTGQAPNFLGGSFSASLKTTTRVAKDGLIQDSDGETRLYKSDKIRSDYTGLYKGANGKYYYVKNGVWQPNYKGIVKNSKGKYLYVKDGVWQSSFRGIVRNSKGKYLFFKAGTWQSSFTGIVKNSKGKYLYFKEGVWQSSFTGIVKNSKNQYLYFKDGVWQSLYNGTVKNSKGKYIYFKDGIYDKTFTGISRSKTSGKDYYVVKGAIDFSVSGIIPINGKDYVVEKGEVLREAGPDDVEVPGTLSGFSLHVWRDDDEYKKILTDANEDGTYTYKAQFLTDGNKLWLYNNVKFEITDVTPTAYKKLFSDLGYPEGRINEVTKEDFYYGGDRIHGPFPEYAALYFESPLPNSGLTLVFNADPTVRAVKIVAKVDGKTVDTVYLVGSDEVQTYSDSGLKYCEWTVEMYAKARRRIEAKIWNGSMTNLEKLQALANYIGKVSHYPGSDSTKKEYNPEWWESMAVDGLDLLYYMAGAPLLERAMALQGGMIDCLAQSILVRAAEEELGLPYLYVDGAVQPGEGVWTGVGTASSTQFLSGHESCIYKDKNEQKYYIDTQGGKWDGEQANCSAHGCKEHIINLR